MKADFVINNTVITACEIQIFNLNNYNDSVKKLKRPELILLDTIKDRSAV